MKTVLAYTAAIAIGLTIGSLLVKSWQGRHATLTIQCSPSAEVIPPATVTDLMVRRQRLLKSL